MLDFIRSNEEVRTGKTLPCETCGKLVYLPPHRVAAFRACSNSCKAKLASVGTIDKICQHCGTYFTVKRWRNGARYCSSECYNKAQKKPRFTVQCVVCGTSISRPEVHLHKSGKNVCGPSCRGALHRRVRPKGAGYARKWLVGRRALSSCERCGYDVYKEILVVHHKDRDRSNNDPTNFEILCPNCHAIEHLVESK